MPYKSLAQERYFNANRAKLGGKVVDEFNAASKGKRLPLKVADKGDKNEAVLDALKKKRKKADPDEDGDDDTATAPDKMTGKGRGGYRATDHSDSE